MLNDQPIESAPRDPDLEIMVWCEDGRWRQVRWLAEDLWVTSDGALHVRGRAGRDAIYITASLWAPLPVHDAAERGAEAIPTEEPDDQPGAHVVARLHPATKIAPGL